jgi:hypothetical protein
MKVERAALKRRANLREIKVRHQKPQSRTPSIASRIALKPGAFVHDTAPIRLRTLLMMLYMTRAQA